MSFADLIRLGIVCRPIERWPGQLQTWGQRRFAPFRASLAVTLDTLERELRMLQARQIVLQVAVSTESKTRSSEPLEFKARDHPRDGDRDDAAPPCNQATSKEEP